MLIGEVTGLTVSVLDLDSEVAVLLDIAVNDLGVVNIERNTVNENAVDSSNSVVNSKLSAAAYDIYAEYECAVSVCACIASQSAETVYVP